MYSIRRTRSKKKKNPTLLRLAFTHSETTSRTFSTIIQILFDILFSFFIIFFKNALHKLPRPCCTSWRPGIPLGSCSPEKQGQCCEHRRYTLRLRHKHFWSACSLRLKRWYVLRFRSPTVSPPRFSEMAAINEPSRVAKISALPLNRPSLRRRKQHHCHRTAVGDLGHPLPERCHVNFHDRHAGQYDLAWRHVHQCHDRWHTWHRQSVFYQRLDGRDDIRPAARLRGQLLARGQVLGKEGDPWWGPGLVPTLERGQRRPG